MRYRASRTWIGMGLAAILWTVVGCGVPRHVLIQTNPPGAKVYLDGKELGTTPLETKILISENKGADPMSIRALRLESPDGGRVVKMITVADDLPDAKGKNVLTYDMPKASPTSSPSETK